MESTRLLKRFQQIVKTPLTEDEEINLKTQIRRHSLDKYSRLYRYLYEMLVGRLYDKKQTLMLIASLLLLSVSPEEKSNTWRKKAKRIIELIIEKDKKKIGITRSFIECKKTFAELWAVIDTPHITITQQYDFIATLAGKNDEDFREDFIQLMEYLEQLEFIKRCKILIAGVKQVTLEHQKAYIEKKIAQHRVLSYSPAGNFTQEVKKYGIDLELQQNVRRITKEISDVLDDMNDLLLDYHKAQVRIDARKKLGRLVSKCIKEAAD